MKTIIFQFTVLFLIAAAAMKPDFVSGKLLNSSYSFVQKVQDESNVNLNHETVNGNSKCEFIWTVQTSGTNRTLFGVKAVSDQIAWVVGTDNTILKTTNGGSTWVNGNLNPGVVSGDVYTIEALDANYAWCSSFSGGSAHIYKTTNAGFSWTEVLSQPGIYINGLGFKDSNNGFAEGDATPDRRWSLWKTSDGGWTWDSTGLYLFQADSEFGWTNSFQMMGDTIWFGTNNTRVYKSTNFGYDWVPGATPGTFNSTCVHFNNSNLGMAGGLGSTPIVLSMDGGITYSNIGNVPGTNYVNGIEGKDSDFWYIRLTRIFRSTNSGGNWNEVYNTSVSQLTAIDFYDKSDCPAGWAVGSGGIILRMTGSQIVSVGNSNMRTPDKLYLAQNYPNPFNPITTISFELKISGKVFLKVYDILGNEVAVLINEMKNPGSYEVQFDASNLSGGIYFYTLELADFSQTRKMIVSK